MPDTPEQPEAELATSSLPQRSLLQRAATPATALYWLTLYVGTHIPNPDMIIGTHVSDKVLHFSAYFVLYVVLATRIRIIRAAWPDVQQMLTLAAMTCIYSAFDEITQGIPIINRYPDVMDAVADCLGVAAAIVLVGLAAVIEKGIRAASPGDNSTDP